MSNIYIHIYIYIYVCMLPYVATFFGEASYHAFQCLLLAGRGPEEAANRNPQGMPVDASPRLAFVPQAETKQMRRPSCVSND